MLASFMTAPILASRFPKELRIGSEKSGSYTRLDGYFALRGEAPEGLGGEPIERLEAEDVTIYRGEDPGELAAATVTAVYSTSPGAPLTVPTGEVFLRMAGGVCAKDRSDDFADAGYQVTKTLFYAPNAAWLRARSGDVADGLNGIADLEALADVVNVEPQMLSARFLR